MMDQFWNTQGAEPVTPLDLYKHAFVSFFPPQAEKTESVRPSLLALPFKVAKHRWWHAPGLCISVVGVVNRRVLVLG